MQSQVKKSEGAFYHGNENKGSSQNTMLAAHLHKQVSKHKIFSQSYLKHLKKIRHTQLLQLVVNYIDTCPVDLTKTYMNYIQMQLNKWI